MFRAFLALSVCAVCGRGRKRVCVLFKGALEEKRRNQKKNKYSLGYNLRFFRSYILTEST